MTYDVIVIGAGSAGCVLAERLSQDSGRRVLLLEAGPDYPTLADLPADLADARNVADSHDWGFTSEPDATGRSIALPRGRVVGGCSAVNATFVPRGFPGDYDAWAAAGNPGWSFQEVLPFFCRAESDLDFGAAPWHGEHGPLTVRRYAAAERSAFSRAFLDAACVAGHAVVDDHNRPGAVGAGPAPVNAVDGTRISSAHAQLARARGRANLTLRTGAHVSHIALHARRASAVVLAGGETLACGSVVLAAGAYASPAILLRSGIGPAEELRALGIAPVLALSGVGRNLIDHPLVGLRLSLTVGVGPEPRHQALVTWRSRSGDGAHACDMHLLSSGPHLDPNGASFGALSFSVMKPTSRGELRLRSADPLAPPRIRPAHLDSASDRARMREGLLEARRIARTAPMAELIAGGEISPAPGIADADSDALDAALRAKVGTYHHPVGTCAMGPSVERGAVVDARGRVHGADGLIVADASIMPDIPAANTHLPTTMVAERIADWLLHA